MHIKATHLKMARDANLPGNKCPYCPFEHAKQAKIYFHINDAHYKSDHIERPDENQRSGPPPLIPIPGPSPSETKAVPSNVTPKVPYKRPIQGSLKKHSEETSSAEQPAKEKRRYAQVTCYKCGKSMPPLGGFVLHINNHLGHSKKDGPLDRDAVMPITSCVLKKSLKSKSFKERGQW